MLKKSIRPILEVNSGNILEMKPGLRDFRIFTELQGIFNGKKISL